MFRKQVTNGKREHKDRIRWRSHEVTRIEAFSDAVFAFAVTLLIVSLEVPKTFDELLTEMRSFVPFAVSFALLFQVWMTQNVFFRRYGLSDNATLILNGTLVFVVLFFVYPLKFLFNSLFFDGYHFKSMEDVKHLFYIYSGGFAAIYFLFMLMYLNALRQRTALQLTDSEAFETRTTIYRHLVMCGIGLLSVLIAACGGNMTGFAGLVYILIGPAVALTHGRRGKVHRRRFEGKLIETPESPQ